jgi:tRNA threonylcarbamoyladenosine biosynthesis protein TsaE
MTIITNSERETAEAGRALAGKLNRGSCVALYGDLGAGKTSFVRGLAEGLGLKSRVTSPTFTIVNEYPGDIPLFHFDLYRINNEDELFDIGWDDYLERGGIIAAEWSENAAHSFPADTVRVSIEKLDGSSRRIVIDIPEGSVNPKSH